MGARLPLRRIVIRLFLFLLFLSTVFMLYLTCFGFPRPVIEMFMKEADARGFYLEVGGLNLKPWEGLVFRNIRLFKKGMIGPPMFEADETVLGFDILQKVHRVRRVRIRNGRLRRDVAWNTLSFRRGDERPARAVRQAHLRGAPDGNQDVRIEMYNCDVQGLRLQRLFCDLRIDGNCIRLDNISGMGGEGDGSGPLAGWIVCQSGSGRYRGHIISMLDPAELLVFLKSKNLSGVSKLIESFAFEKASPRLDAIFSGTSGRDWTLALNGRFLGRDFEHNGVEVTAAKSPVHIEFSPDKRTVTLDPLVIYREEGTANVGFTVDLRDRTVAFHGSSSIDPRAAAMLISRRGPDYISGYYFGGPVRFTAKGSVCYTNAAVCNVEAGVEAQYLGYSSFIADECSFTLRRLGHSTALSDFEANIYGGRLSGGAFFSPSGDSANMSYHVKCKVEDMDFRRLAEALLEKMEKKEGYTGRLQGLLEVRGIAKKGMERTIEGSGKVKISEGNILRLPLFGDLSGMLVKIVPGLGYVLRQTEADASFEIAGGKLLTDELRIEGDILSLKANGCYDLRSHGLDFDTELRFLKRKTFVGDILQTVLLPVTRMFSVRLQGSLEKPEWRPVNF